MMNSSVIEIYTDGACSGNPGTGGFGVVMKYKEQRKELAYGFKLTTNNRMELIAVIVALESFKKENSDVIVNM
jgi:ribonuclease HI